MTSEQALLVGVTEGAIIDIETTGTGADDEILTLGYVSSDTMSILQRTSRKPDPFYAEVKEALQTLPTPIYAYNIRFEREFIKRELGIQIAGKDLMEPWRALARTCGVKWPKLDELVSEPEEYFDVMRFSGGDVPGLWKKYLTTMDPKFLEVIMEHNRSDLLRELYLLVQYPHLYALKEKKRKQ